MSTWFSQSLPEPPDLIRGKKKFKAGHGGTCTNPSTWKEGAADICELETSLRYMASSTPAGATARPSLKKKKFSPTYVLMEIQALPLLFPRLGGSYKALVVNFTLVLSDNKHAGFVQQGQANHRRLLA